MMDNKNLKENIRTFSLDKGPRGSQGYERVLLVPFGLTGHGLSSFINSCMYTLHDGEFTEHAEVANTLGGVTMKRNAFPLSDHITIVDNRGFPSMQKVYQAEVYAQLGNFIPIGREVHWKYNFRAMMEEIEESELETNNTDFIVPIFVYSCRCLISSCEMDEIRKCMENCTQMTGIFPIVVLTHTASGHYLQTERKFRVMGAEVVIGVENYTRESHTKTQEMTTNILMVIDSALKNVEYRMRQPRDLMSDKTERKKFLLNFVHMSDLKRQKHKTCDEEEKT